MLDRKKLDENGIKESWLARQLGISQSHLSRILSGERKWRPGMHDRALELINRPVQVDGTECASNTN